MIEIDKKKTIDYYVAYIKVIVNGRYGLIDQARDESYIDVKLRDNLSSANVCTRPVMNGMHCNQTCVVVLTKKEEILVFFDDDLSKMDSFSLAEIRSFLKKLKGVSSSTD